MNAPLKNRQTVCLVLSCAAARLPQHASTELPSYVFLQIPRQPMVANPLPPLHLQDGLSVLPENCLALCGGFAGITICMNLMRDFLPGKWGRFVPLPMCMALVSPRSGCGGATRGGACGQTDCRTPLCLCVSKLCHYVMLAGLLGACRKLARCANMGFIRVC